MLCFFPVIYSSFNPLVFVAATPTPDGNGIPIASASFSPPLSIRNIEKGEEITIPYVAPNITNKERQNIFLSHYGFTCSCPFCIQVPKYSTNRSILFNCSLQITSSSVLPSFENWCLDPTFPDDILINAHLHSLQDFELDGRNDHSARDTIRHLYATVMCYGALEDADNFRRWMRHVSEARLRNNDNK